MSERVKVAPKTGNKVRLLLDSGAYGAWSRGESIAVKDYIKYCRDNERLIWRLVNLDVIPGQFGRRDNSQGEVEASAEMSYYNQQKIKMAGLRPIPVFHQGERLYWLERMLRDGEDYIGLSPSKFVRLDDQKRWLDMCFNLLCDDKGRPLVKTHGFAATSFELMTQYPWRSVDSTTWSLTPGYGQIIVPAMIGDEYDYTHPPTRVIMSGVMQKNQGAQARQYEYLSKPHRKAVKRFIYDVVGSTLEGQRYSSIERCKAMLVYYVELGKHLYDVRFSGHRSRLFGPDHLDVAKLELEPFPPWHLILALATEALHKEWSKIMNDTGANDRLLSYWYLKDKPYEILERFVIDGKCGEYVRSKQKANWDNETYMNRRRLALFERISRGEDDEAE